MELWIRSQSKEKLVKIENIYISNEIRDGRAIMGCNSAFINQDLGTYATKERALEVLDEIQEKIKVLLYLKPNVLMRLEDIKAAKAYFEKLNKQEFITCDSSFEIVPISTHVVVYEMPKE